VCRWWTDLGHWLVGASAAPVCDRLITRRYDRVKKEDPTPPTR
jgi:hypothetical protein